MSNRGRVGIGCWLGICLAASLATGVEPTAGELAWRQRWTAAKFSGQVPPESSASGLSVLANYESVQRNARGGRPLMLSGKSYSRGLYTHAPSKVLVRLPGPGRALSAVVGVDSNAQTSGGRGSVVFSVSAGDKALFTSAVLREGQAGVPVNVDLAGGTELLLSVAETADGIACDQADWADLKVVLADGRELWLGDLPLREVQPLTADVPFSFSYGGLPAAQLLAGWPSERSARELDADRTERTWTATDPKTGLQVRCVAIEYRRFPTVEWTVYFKNTGATDTPILADVQALDVALGRPTGGEFLLRHHVGSPADGNDYGPLETRLAAGTSKRLGGRGGRPTNADWSYFNLDQAGQGVIVAVGWPGQWAAQLSVQSDRTLRLQAGQELTHFKLHPGEEVRTPLVAVQFWEGDWLHAQNVWRRWMNAHNVPRQGGRLPAPQLLASSSRQLDEMIRANEENQIAFIDRYRAERIGLDYWWMDAGWYVNKTGWPNVGTWEVDAKRFPRGLRAVTDHAHRHGLKALLWFEPERVTGGTWLAEQHPDWILGGAPGGLLDLGNPAARRWLTDHVDRLITQQGIDLYRQDFNMDPLDFWRRNDPPDRQGITEIQHVTGLLAFWDELRAKHPNMLIDSCASGGRRNDLETMRRAVPLWRSDYAYECRGHQAMTWGISLWLPYHGTGTVAAREASYYGSGPSPVEPYAFWSNAAPSLGLGVDVRETGLDYAALRKLVDQWRAVNANYAGDFYPLTPWSRDPSSWIAWQFDRPEAGEGMVQAFRREASLYEAARCKLRGLDPAARYLVRPIESSTGQEYSGRELLERGLLVAIEAQPGAALLTYQRVGPR